MDDCADAGVHLMKAYSGDTHVNVGSGENITILELTELVSKVVGFEGRIVHDLSKPDGTQRKLMSAEVLHSLGWAPKIGLEQGIANAYRAFLTGDDVECKQGDAA